LPGWESSAQFARKFQKKISAVYCDKELDAIAKQTGFKVRKSKLTPLMFVDTVLFKEADNAMVSLDDHCIALRQRYDLDIKKQSLDERFDAGAVNFIRELLKKHLAKQIASTLDKERLQEALGHFSSVKIKDSTRFQVSESLKKHYPGSAGGNSGAGIHIQFEFDILNGKVNDLNVTHALRQDATDARQTMCLVEQGSLIIRDLGYFSTDVLAHIQAQEAYYITRPKSGISFYHSTSGERIEFEQIYRKMKRQKLSSMELPVCIIKNNLPMRLIIEMLPDNEVEKRMRKAQKDAKKEGWTISDEYKSRAKLNLFMTNVPSCWIHTQDVRKVYQLRWQIELRFKAWKSFYGLDAIKKTQLYRFECYLYATLLLIMIHTEIGNRFFSILWKQTGKTLSFLKFHKTILQGIMILREAILKENEKVISYLEFLYQVSYGKLLTEKRKHQRAPLENILSQTIE
jgi:Transposase DDE domain